MSLDTVLPGDLVFIHGTRLIDEPVKWATKSKYTHVAGVILGRQLVEAQGLRKTGLLPSGAYEGSADLYRCRALSEAQRRTISRFVLNEIDSRYDYLLIGWEAFRLLVGVVLPYYKNDRRICSTLWADAFKAAGIHLCPGLKYPTPGELSESKKLTMLGPY